MIKELENSNCSFFQKDPLFRKYFMDREKTENEESKEDEIYYLISGFCKKVFGNAYNIYMPDIEYLDDFGFYELVEADRGNFDVYNYGEDINEVFERSIIKLLFQLYSNKEVHNRKRIEEEYHQRFGDIEYDWLLYPREEALNAWKVYYDGNIPDRLVDLYEKKLNYRVWNIEKNIFFKYNGEEFILDKNKTMKREM